MNTAMILLEPKTHRKSTVVDKIAREAGIEPSEYRKTEQTRGKIPRLPEQAKDSAGMVMPGRIVFVRSCKYGRWEIPTEIMTPGGLALPSQNTFTEALYFGIVVRTGVFTYSSHTRTAKESDILGISEKFPLPPGTLILHSCGRPMHDAQERTYVVNCDHLAQIWMPDEVWPEQIQALREAK